MHVWYMNLKDNRENAPKDGSIQKCNYCFQHNIVGVGWAVENERDLFKRMKKLEEHYKNTPDEYSKLVNALDHLNEIEVGDLVWVHNFVDGKYYILRISDAKIRVAQSDIARDNDIGFYLCWDKKALVDDADVPKELALRKIIQSQNQDDIILKTLEIFNNGYDEL